MKTFVLFKEFYESEKAGGIVLICCTALSLIIANLSFGNDYIGFWEFKLFEHSISHWVNDGLMAIFFLLIGLELEREIYVGELSNFKDALFPILAALGGMIVPAGIYLIFNFGTEAQSGFGIPMATDIAFAIGILSLIGKRVPNTLKVFLTALAVIDDLGAIIIIAIFYTKSLVLTNLFISLAIFAVLLIFNRLKINSLIIYIIGGIVMWYFMLNSGVHATITGVLLAFAIPFRKGDTHSISYKLQHFLHKPVAFIILPLFALANTAIILSSNIGDALFAWSGLGIAFGLIIGKPMGIVLFTSISVLIGLSKLPSELNWKSIISSGFLAGIGFTMSIFITLLAFEDLTIINNSKLSIIFSSCIAGIIGFFLLYFLLNKQTIKDE